MYFETSLLQVVTIMLDSLAAIQSICSSCNSSPGRTIRGVPSWGIPSRYHLQWIKIHGEQCNERAEPMAKEFTTKNTIVIEVKWSRLEVKFLLLKAILSQIHQNWDWIGKTRQVYELIPKVNREWLYDTSIKCLLDMDRYQNINTNSLTRQTESV